MRMPDSPDYSPVVIIVVVIGKVPLSTSSKVLTHDAAIPNLRETTIVCDYYRYADMSVISNSNVVLQIWTLLRAGTEKTSRI